jgi:hypothetical protein
MTGDLASTASNALDPDGHALTASISARNSHS